MVAVGDEDEIGGGQSGMIALTPRVDVDDLASRFEHEAGMLDGSELDDAGFALDLLDGAGGLRQADSGEGDEDEKTFLLRGKPAKGGAL
ncbi:MAG: hypothetical protein ACRD8O_20165 [Bryobacteraceae bacterium]